MADVIRADLFCEDRGHEQFVRPLLTRVVSDLRRSVELRTQNAKGGHGRAVSEFKAYQRAARGMRRMTPHLLVLVIDANCDRWNAKREELRTLVDETVFPSSVVACPDPHVERWCMADPESFAKVIGEAPLADPGKCERDSYKQLLRDSIERTGNIILTDPTEYAPDLVKAMDLYRAGKNQPSLSHFLSDLRSALQVIG